MITGHRKVVRLAPAHIAPPSRPAPEWVLDMQVSRAMRTTVGIQAGYPVYDKDTLGYSV